MKPRKEGTAYERTGRLGWKDPDWRFPRAPHCYVITDLPKDRKVVNPGNCVLYYTLDAAVSQKKSHERVATLYKRDDGSLAEE